jgi:hypothetical protein
MSGIDAYNLKEGKRYKFITEYNLIDKTSDGPHSYEATYEGRKGDGKLSLTWVFSDFIDTASTKKREKIEIQFFGMLRLNIELIKGKKTKTLRRKTSRRKSEKEEKK